MDKDFDSYKIRTAIGEFSKVASKKNGYAYLAGYYEAIITDLLEKSTKKTRDNELAFIEKDTVRIKSIEGYV